MFDSITSQDPIERVCIHRGGFTLMIFYSEDQMIDNW